MIGPHEGQELDLMLAGLKHLSMFHDDITNDQFTPEDIIPEKKFEPYVESKTFLRFEKTLITHDKTHLKYVCFTHPDHTWRANAFFWIKEMVIQNSEKTDAAYELFIGRLLGYQDNDIHNFIEQNNLSLASTIRT